MVLLVNNNGILTSVTQGKGYVSVLANPSARLKFHSLGSLIVVVEIRPIASVALAQGGRESHGKAKLPLVGK